LVSSLAAVKDFKVIQNPARLPKTLDSLLGDFITVENLVLKNRALLAKKQRPFLIAEFEVVR
jgi:hypothetical protein